MDPREPPPHHQRQFPPPHHLYHLHQQHQQAAANMMMAPTPPSSYPTMIVPPSSAAAAAAAAAGFPFNSVILRSPLTQPPPPESKPPLLSDVAAGSFDEPSPASSGMRFSIEPAKKKRGRPRKYTPDGNIALGLSTTPVSSSAAAAGSVGHGDSGGGEGSGGGAAPAFSSSDNPARRHRGRPPSSVKRQLDALGGVGGIGFTPHVIFVNPGEDISAKIYSFSQQGPRTICILSANGAISNATLRQPALGGGTVTYEGRYEIISLSGSFSLSDTDGHKIRTGGLRVTLAGRDGRVFGGGVAGMLTAASSVQVIVGSFVDDSRKPSELEEPKSGPSSGPPGHMMNFGGPMSAASPPFEASSDSSDDQGSSNLNHNAGIYGNSGQQQQEQQSLHSMHMYQVMGGQNPQ
ncbi:AT-hook motif nuclear-localized protein 8 [Linum grandiflorum]